MRRQDRRAGWWMSRGARSKGLYWRVTRSKRVAARRLGLAGRTCRTALRPRGNLEYLARLDLVGVAQLVAIRFENRVVGVRITKVVLGDFAQRVAGLDGVGRRTCTCTRCTRCTCCTWL